MILSDSEILRQIELGNIKIDPFDPTNLGSNSYDVHLGKFLAVYENDELDARQHNPVRQIEIPEEGFVLQPRVLYLGVTEEYTETLEHVPFLEGKSSTGRLGISIHATAGKGDVGFCNHWTLEITTVMPVRVYAGMPIGQIIYFVVQGDVLTPYNKKPSAKYNEINKKPVGSKMFENSF